MNRELTVQNELLNDLGRLIPDKPIAFNRDFVRLGIGVKGALFLSQAIYWSRRTEDAEGWFYKTIEKWEEETGLTDQEQRKVKKDLIEKGFLKVEKRGIPAKNYFLVMMNEIATQLFYAKAPDKYCGINSTGAVESTGHSYTENTTERGEKVFSQPLERVKTTEDGGEVPPRGKVADPKGRELLKRIESLRGSRFTNTPRQLKYINMMLASGVPAKAIGMRWAELRDSEWWKERELEPDMLSVSKDFDRKPYEG